MKEMPGRLLGNRYKILENIGEGGMARVYRGMDTKLNRLVAIKVLYEQFAGDPDFLRRFKQEAKAAARLSHPHIVNIYDEGEEDGLHYIIMEYVSGCTLKELIQRQGRLQPQEAVEIVIQICEALDHAHSQKVIHRDIKPQNIMLTGDGRVKVTDFGIARAAADATITYGRSLLGSVYYSSPEQARGHYTDSKSDIYSLGVLLYEMLTGVVPFSGESPISVALKHLQEDVVPPSHLVPELPAPLENIILKAMHKERQSRYNSALELKGDLESWLLGEDARNFVGSYIKRPYRSELSEEQFTETNRKQGEEMRKKSRFFKKVVAIGVVLVAVFFAVFWGYRFLYNFLFVPEVKVPELVGMSLQEAERELDSLGLGYNVIREEHSDTVPLNHIISQETPPQRSVRKGKTINLVLSLGPEYVEVPYLIGKTEYESRLTLSDIGLNLVVDSYEYSEEVAPGYIIRQDPGKDFRLMKGEAVHVVVSEGKRPFSLRNFQGWSLEDTKEWLNLYGLVLRNTDEEYSDEFAAGQVISQFPAAGELVQEGDAVDIVVSKGREPGTYNTFTINFTPQVPLGQHIKVYIEDEEGTRVIFEGAYEGGVISAQGINAGKVVLMELRDGEYHIIDIKNFP